MIQKLRINMIKAISPIHFTEFDEMKELNYSNVVVDELPFLCVSLLYFRLIMSVYDVMN